MKHRYDGTYLEEVDLNGAVAKVHDDRPGGSEPGVKSGDTGQHVFITDLEVNVSRPKG